LFSVAVTLAMGSGCGRRVTPVEVGNERQILLIGNGTDPEDLDPHVTTGLPEHHIHMALFEGLVNFDPKDLHSIPGVAESWDVSTDGFRYTFHLRKNAKWSNGDPVTAGDFTFSYERMLTPSFGAEYAYMFYVVENAEAYHEGKLGDFNRVGFKAVDSFTLEVRLKAPTPYFLSLVNHSSWYPVHPSTIRAFGRPDQRGTRWTRPGNHVGNGPFKLKAWNVSDVVVVEKNPLYWDAAAVALDEIRFYAIENQTTEERNFRSGQLHITDTVSQNSIARLVKEKPAYLQVHPWIGTYYYIFNTRIAPLNDVRVRKALSMAIDRSAIVRNITRGGQVPAFHFTPPETAGYTTNARLTENVLEARRLLAEAGFPDGVGFPALPLLYNTSDAHRPIAEAIQDMWKRNLNIDLRLENQEWKVYLNSRSSGAFAIARAGWIGDYNDPNTFLNLPTGTSGNNHTGWINEEYDRLIARAGNTLDTTERHGLFQQAEAILVDELPILPIYFYVRTYLKHEAVQGWHPNILDQHPYKFVRLVAGPNPAERISW
jgi:oligopeptide transport system substrate-binding protein